jgi:hypothetical protein
VQATSVLKGLLGSIEAGLDQAAAYAAPMSAWVQQQLPGVLSAADSVTGVVATAVDTLACYRLVGAALVAEVCVARAADQVQAEVKAEMEAAEAARAAAERAEAERRRAEAEAAERKRREAEAAAAEAQRRQDEARRAEEAERLAEAQRRIDEEKERRAASAQREEYSLEEPVEAASLRNNPVKVTRGEELVTGKSAAPARAGCMGCGTVMFLALILGAAVRLLA